MSSRRWRRGDWLAAVPLVTLAVVVAGAWGAAFLSQPDAADVSAANVPEATLTEAAPEPASLAPARKALASAEVVSVLGDSTGNASNEWVALWAQTMGREVRVHFLDPDTLEWQPEPRVYGSGGQPLEVWNAGASGETADYPKQRGLDVLVPEPPDVVIYSFGHNNSADNIAGQMDGLSTAVGRKWPDAAEVVVLQNPGTGAHGATQAATVDSLRAFAVTARLPVVDVFAEFPQKLGPVMVDDRHPNDAGSALWAQTMEKALN